MFVSLPEFTLIVIGLSGLTDAFKYESCGEFERSMDSRIVGGREAGWKEFPWQVSITKYGRHFCGGSIISEDWVASAAHCFYNVREELEVYEIIGGMHYQHANSQGRQIRKVFRLVKHPDFGHTGYRNDIALLKVEASFNFTSSKKHIGSICLPLGGEHVEGSITISGWGKTAESAFSSATSLNAVQVPVMSDLTCQYRYFSLWNLILGSKFDSASMFCAGYLEGGKDACQGDSGGPAIQYENGRAILKGIVSWGTGCARSGKPGVYTKVPHFVAWILDVISN